MLHRLPELHRDADREDGDERAGQRGGEETGRDVVEHGRDGNRERGEVRPAASREPAGRALRPPTWLRETRLGRRDRAMLGAVQAQRAAAEEPEDDQADPGRELEPARERDEGEGEQQRGEEEEALAEAGDAAAADERCHRGRQLEQAADERDPALRDRRTGIAPSCSSPAVVANAQ